MPEIKVKGLQLPGSQDVYIFSPDLANVLENPPAGTAADAKAVADALGKKADLETLNGVTYQSSIGGGSPTELVNLYSDKEKKQKIYPSTKIEVITDKVGNKLSEKLTGLVYSEKNGENAEIKPTSNDADTLNGKSYEMIKNEILKEQHPVGSWWFSENPTSPAILFGGDWEQIIDRTLVGAGGKYPTGSTGGEDVHKLTIDELPAHNPKIIVHNTNGNNPETHGLTFQNWGSENPHFSKTVGKDQPHNNMPPYYATYIWRRIA